MPGPVENGPPAWANWRAFDEGGSDGEALEYVLYSDCRWVGEITEGLGPYELLNTIGARVHPAIGEAQPVLALRVEQALERPPPPEDLTKHVTGTFHGGWIDEEIAALLSLVLGVRCRSGGMWRSFEPGANPKGKPYTFDLQPPLLARPREQPQLPHLPVEARFEKATPWLNHYRELPADQALALARSARAFQLGIWTADDDPDLSWLRLITALETAAKSWAGKARERPLDQLTSTWPELAGALGEVEPGPRDRIASLIAPQSRIKRAVMRFIAEFAPAPPMERPRKVEQLDWDRLEQHIAAIYDRRSEMLHEAIPLPRSMTGIHRPSNAPPFTETAFGSMYHDSNWPQEKAPMPLWTFTYIVTGALKGWWRSLGGDELN
jgi:hypothetical protein